MDLAILAAVLAFIASILMGKGGTETPEQRYERTKNNPPMNKNEFIGSIGTIAALVIGACLVLMAMEEQGSINLNQRRGYPGEYQRHREQQRRPIRRLY